MDTSDGEIKEDFSDISEEEYFDNIANKIEKRRLELEVLNQLVGYDDYPKENRYENHRNKQIVSTTSRSYSNSTNFRKEKPRKTSEARSRSYRASSIFSSSRYPLPKKRRQKKKRKYTQKLPSPVMSLTSSDEEVTEIKDDSEDDELLRLRLNALTSKQEVKELREVTKELSFDEESSPVNHPTPAPSPSDPPLPNNTNEEDQLRIAALRSAILKKKDHFRKRKQLRKLENERPYSPTDSFEPIVDVAMDLSSPLGSPLLGCDINEEIDMDISNSPADLALPDDDNRESCDMELVSSPQQPKSVDESDNEDENALRSMLLSSISDKRKQDEEKSSENEQEVVISEPSSPQESIAKNLKLAVERIKQQKQQVLSQKSGTKTIKMLLEEQKNKKLSQVKEDESQVKNVESQVNDDQCQVKEYESQVKNDEIEVKLCQVEEIHSPKSLPEFPTNDLEPETSETVLIERIIEDKSLQPADDALLDKASLTVEPSDSSFSTITDTKNIPLLPEPKKLDSRLVTSLDNVIRPVKSLVITLRAESSEDEYDIQKKKSSRRVVHKTIHKASSDFEKNLDSFLKNIRSQQEQSDLKKSLSSTNAAPNKQQSSPKTSAVKHLPLSSQVEYEKLMQKMKVLQEAKQRKQKAGTLKRTKSQSSTTEKSIQTPQNSTLLDVIKKDEPSKPQPVDVVPQKVPEKKSTKIEDTLSKIPLLDEAARMRLIEKTENNYLNHSKNLLESTETNIKLLDENSLDFKRREKIESKISELEKSLIKYKKLLQAVNIRIKSNAPKILQSQRDMIKLRNHQHKFGQICTKVGETVRGESYRLPEHETAVIDTNFLKISEKTDEIHKVIITDQTYTSKQFKLLSDKVKEFVQSASKTDENTAVTQTNDNSQDNINSGSATIRSVSQLIASCENEDNEMPNEDIEEAEKPHIPKYVKRVLENMDQSTQMNKKAKTYESPLEFLQSATVANRKSVNQIVCPFAMEGTCNDAECKYLHL